jgi:hypothetical protein
MMAAALSRMDVGQWAGANGIELVRAASAALLLRLHLHRRDDSPTEKAGEED